MPSFIKNEYFYYAIIGIIIGFGITISIEIGIALAIALIGILMISDKPLHALIFLIILTPFTGVAILKSSIMGIPGAKPVQIFAVYIVILSIFNRRDSQKMPKFGKYFISFLLLVFTVSVFRSLDHLEMINLLSEDKLGSSRYLLSEFIKPLLYLTPFVIILKYANQMDKIELIMRSLTIAVTLLSIFVLFLYFFKVPDRGDVSIISEYYSETMGLHRNNLATFYILAFPILLANYFNKKNLTHLCLLGITLIGVAFLYSRGAYLTITISFLFYLLLSKRTKYLPLLIVIAIIISFFMTSSIIERATLGWQSGDVSEISAGRVDDIWLPIIQEYANKPLNLIFGDGRYAVRSTEAASLEGMLAVGHPHNMYLELLIDTGIISFIIILSFYIILLVKLYKLLPMNKSKTLKEYQIALMVSISAFLFSGMTDRSFLPNLENCFLWSILALSITIIETINQQSRFPNRDKNSSSTLVV